MTKLDIRKRPINVLLTFGAGILFPVAAIAVMSCENCGSEFHCTESYQTADNDEYVWYITMGSPKGTITQDPILPYKAIHTCPSNTTDWRFVNVRYEINEFPVYTRRNVHCTQYDV
jgi:hypothetical protein